MNKLILILIAFLGFSSITEAQKKPPIIVLETVGKVKAKPEKGGCFKTIKPTAGSALKENAKLNLKEGASILILQDGVFKRYDKAGKFNLVSQDVGNRTGKRNFDPLFAEFIKSSYVLTFQRIKNGEWDISGNKSRGDGWSSNDSSDPKSVGGWGTEDPKSVGGWGTEDPKSVGGWGVDDPRNGNGWGVTPPSSAGGWGAEDPKSVGGWGTTDPKSVGGWGTEDPKSVGGWGTDDPKSVGGWGTDDPKSVGGWGIEDMTIQPTVPGGKYIADEIIISWLPIEGVDSYLVCILDENLELMHKQVTKGTSVKVDATGKDKNKTYYWQIFAHNTRAISPPITFNLADDEFVEDIKSAGENSDIYGNSGPALQGMMDAVAYESGGLFKECYILYKDLTAMYPNNDLVRINYAAFCLRMGQHKKAKEIIERI